jgi:hypothetical protein
MAQNIKNIVKYILGLVGSILKEFPMIICTMKFPNIISTAAVANLAAYFPLSEVCLYPSTKQNQNNGAEMRPMIRIMLYIGSLVGTNV